MQLVSMNHIRVVNSDGVDCIYNIHSQQVESFTKVPGFQIDEFVGKHFYLDKHMPIKY